MVTEKKDAPSQKLAEGAVEMFREELGPFVVATDETRMPMIFTDAKTLLNNIVFANQRNLELMGYERSEL